MLWTYVPREYSGDKSITARNAATKSEKFKHYHLQFPIGLSFLT